jgi:hypothetical protein
MQILVGVDAAYKNLNYIIIKFYSTLPKIKDFDPPIRRVENTEIRAITPLTGKSRREAAWWEWIQQI